MRNEGLQSRDCAVIQLQRFAHPQQKHQRSTKLIAVPYLRVEKFNSGVFHTISRVSELDFFCRPDLPFRYSFLIKLQISLKV